MDTRVRARYEARAAVVKAMAHPTRLFLVDTLANGERCVCELTELVGADVSTVSKHLTLLRQAGIVRDERRGAMVFYSLRMPCVLSWFTCVDAALRSTAKERLAATR